MLSRALSRMWVSGGCLKSRVVAHNVPITRTLAAVTSAGHASLHRPSSSSTSSLHRPSTSLMLCSCGCGIHGFHTRGDVELVNFLQDEIVLEKQAVHPSLPSHLGDFAVKASEAGLTLTRTFNDEKVTVTLNVNYSICTDDSSLDDLCDDESEVVLKSRPPFQVDIAVGSKTMSFTCSYASPADHHRRGQNTAEDIFVFNGVTLYEGEWTDATYCVSGEVLDEGMYDLLMNMLEERGVSNEFAEQLATLCANYEHSRYVGLLQSIRDFIKRT